MFDINMQRAQACAHKKKKASRALVSHSKGTSGLGVGRDGGGGGVVGWGGVGGL